MKLSVCFPLFSLVIAGKKYKYFARKKLRHKNKAMETHFYKTMTNI